MVLTTIEISTFFRFKMKKSQVPLSSIEEGFVVFFAHCLSLNMELTANPLNLVATEMWGVLIIAKFLKPKQREFLENAEVIVKK